MSDGVIGGELVERAAPSALVLDSGVGVGAAAATAPGSAPATAPVRGKRGRGETVARWGVAEELVTLLAGAPEKNAMILVVDDNGAPELHKTEQGALRAIEAAGLDRAWLVREVKIERKARLV